MKKLQFRPEDFWGREELDTILANTFCALKAQEKFDKWFMV